MSILNKFTENLNKEFNNSRSLRSHEFRMPAVTRENHDSISLKVAMIWALILHPVFVGSVGLILLIASLLGIHLSIFDKPKPKMNDIEFVLVDKEDTPKDKNTKFRADINSRTGGINDPSKPISMPASQSSAPAKPSSGSPAPAQKPTPTKKPSLLDKIKKPTQQPPKQQTTTQKYVQPSQEVQQAIPKPELAKPQPPTAKPSIKPPMTPKPVAKPSSSPFQAPVPPGGTKAGQYSTGPISGSGSSTKGGSAGGGTYSPNPSLAPVGSGSGSKIASGSGSGKSGSGSGTGSGSSAGGGGGNPGGGGGRPGIDAIKQPDWGAYMRELQRRIKMNWEPPKGNESKRVVLIFKIAKSGQLQSVSVLKSSGLQNVDNAAINAVKLAAPFRQLPPEFSGSNIDIQFTFDYNVYGGLK